MGLALIKSLACMRFFFFDNKSRRHLVCFFLLLLLLNIQLLEVDNALFTSFLFFTKQSTPTSRWHFECFFFNYVVNNWPIFVQNPATIVEAEKSTLSLSLYTHTHTHTHTYHFNIFSPKNQYKPPNNPKTTQMTKKNENKLNSKDQNQT